MNARVQWLVTQTDDSGSTHLVADHLDEKAAEDLVEEFTQRGHKQFYAAHAYQGDVERKNLIVRLRALE